MATLTEAAYYARRTINWTLMIAVLFLIARFLLSTLLYILYLLFPPKPPPPNHLFNILPKVKFPQVASPSAAIDFKLETIEGRVPQASGSGVVLFMPKQSPNLLAITRTQEFAKTLQFDINPVQISKNVYRFEDKESSLRTLQYDIVSNNFILRYGYEYDIGLFAEKNFNSDERIISEASEYIKNLNIIQEDYKNGNAAITYLRVIGNKLFETTSLSKADAVRVDFFRDNILGTAVYTPIPSEGSISITYSGSTNIRKKILQFQYIYWPVDYTRIGTYELKSSETAWEELKSGKGYIARYPRQGSTAVVRSVKIGLYDSIEPQNYIQPIFVFEGDDGFLGYVHAVSPEWVEQ